VTVDVREFTPDDHDWAYALLFPNGAPSRIASRQQLYDPLTLPGFVAWNDGKRVGLAIYIAGDDECELLSLDSAAENVGSGTALIEAVKTAARGAGCARLWLNTTNDNTHAIRFYQRRGFRLRTARPGAVDRERETIKPEIALRGNDDIPIRDELEFVIDL
jgi:GNAT superfamily N-acetyltransferase